MTWSNYGRGLGKWSIDHITPLDSFNLINKEQFLKAANHKTFNHCGLKKIPVKDRRHD
jgi:hypothetical protein